MKVYLDNTPLEPERPTVAAAFEAARAAAEKRDRVVVEALLDGEPLEDDQIEAPPESAPPGNELRFLSADPRRLVRSTLLDMAEAIEQVRSTQQETAEALQTGAFADAFEKLRGTVTVWEMLQRALRDGPALLRRDISAVVVDVDGRPLTIAGRVGELNSHLVELKRSLTAEDWSSLADLLGDDMDRQAETWQVVLRELAEAIAPAGPGDPSAN